jgi:hypothetical protein
LNIKTVFKHIKNVIINVISFQAVGFMYEISQKGCTRLTTASDKVYQLLVGGSLRLLPPLKLVAMI